MSAQRRLFLFGVVIFAANLVATLVAAIVNWPAQFGGVGTDAASEALSRGTAISAPLLPVAILVASLVLLRRPGRWSAIGIAGLCLFAVAVLIGGIGEAVAPATPDVPKAVLVGSGVVSAAIAVTLLVLVVGAFRERRRARASR